MLHFFTSHLRSHLFRSISMFSISCICIIVYVVLLFLYQNSSKALTYYNYNIIDDRRFVISSDSNYFDMFSRNAKWLPKELSKEMESDPKLNKVQAYSLVELPVLAKFSLFEFALETDIPIFSVTDSALPWINTPIGISRAMIDFYNMKIAGSSAMFPQIPELLIKGQSVRMTFWSSKIFPPLSHVGTPIDGVITKIDENFPGFWLTLPESIVRAKMWEIGYSLPPPYKIIAYMRDISDMSYIQDKYSQYHLEFDLSMKHKLAKQINLIRNIFFGISLFFSSILGIFFVFLLFSFFRERRDVFRIVYIFWLSGIKARILTLAEPIFLLIFGCFGWAICSYFLVSLLIQKWVVEFLSRGVSYVLFPVEIYSIVIICLSVCMLFGGVIVILEYVWRRKELMR